MNIIPSNVTIDPEADPGSTPPPRPVKNSHKKKSTKCDSLYFIFLSPLSEVSGSATVTPCALPKILARLRMT